MFLARYLLPSMSILLILTAACSRQSTSDAENPDLLYTVAVQTLETQLTQGAFDASQSSTSPTPAIQLPPTFTPPPAETPIPGGLSTTSTPNPTLPPSFTPTASSTPTLSTPMISATRATNCRFGPARGFDVLGYLVPGQKVEVRGRISGGGWWFIQNPDRPGENCWVWDQTTEVEGDVSSLPVITPPPSPTPTDTLTPTMEVPPTVTNTPIPYP